MMSEISSAKYVLALLILSATFFMKGSIAQFMAFGDMQYNGNVDTGSGGGELQTVSKLVETTCTPQFAAEKDHTMCLNDDPRVISSGVDAQTRKEIIDYHNQVRREVSPAATDLTTVVWDNILAAVAGKWARQCEMGHDGNRKVPEYGSFIGQNVAGGYRNWKNAMSSWFNEVQLYKFGEDPDIYLGPGGWKKIGHYTQMVQSKTFRVGCGFARCRNTPYGRYYVCNYGDGQSSISNPYKSGRRCSACPDSCRNGLCDCGGKYCLNGGTLDVNTCTCQCTAIYSGDDCGILNCPASEPFYCWRDMLPSSCKQFVNVPHLCPYMCGICSKGTPSSPPGISANPTQASVSGRMSSGTTVTSTTTTESVFTSTYNCTYRGLRSSISECKNYGDRGMDMQFCSSKGGKFTCSDCEMFYNIKRDYCPVMCGLCDAPCNGMECFNGGRLDPETCTCECPQPYTGSMCEFLNCPEKEKWHCSLFEPSYCSIYSNVPGECPYLCGIC